MADLPDGIMAGFVISPEGEQCIGLYICGKLAVMDGSTASMFAEHLCDLIEALDELNGHPADDVPDDFPEGYEGHDFSPSTP